jgi:undecaprenyl diphosphate synthase
MHNQNIPQCVGFIMDGNRRWAQKQGVSSFEGHAQGYGALKEMIEAVYEAHIPHMVCYAFSTENWNRSKEEVEYLMKLLGQGIAEFPTMSRKEGKHIRIRIIGERDRLSPELQRSIAEAENDKDDEVALTVWIALSYGGRAEIVDAVNRAISIGAPVTEETFATLLWTGEMPDPDIVIRTSGEKRISNFLLWKSAYSEFFFIDTLWPDFGKTEFQSILEQYAKRVRRIGK